MHSLTFLLRSINWDFIVFIVAAAGDDDDYGSDDDDADGGVNVGNTYRANTYQPGDDSFRISLTVQMADSLTAIQDSYHQISFGAKVGIPMIFRNLTVKVIRTLSEVADLIINATVNGTLTYSTG